MRGDLRSGASAVVVARLVSRNAPLQTGMGDPAEMALWLQRLMAGLGLLLVGWSLPRRVAGCRWRLSPALLLDLAMPGLLLALW